jgi:2-iminobutanoate/2-iminopropanoate deaminase
VPIDPETKAVVAGDVTVQAERVLENLAAILRAAGSSLNNVVRVGVFLKNMGDFARFNEIYAGYFTFEPPARTTIEAARLPKDVLVEIDAVALA